MAIVAPTTPTPAPTPPDRADRATFSARATASFDHLKNSAIPQLAGLATNAYNNALEVVTLAEAADDSAGLATLAAASAAASAASAQASPGTTATSSTPLTVSLGPKSLVIQTGKTLVAGQQVVIARTSAPATRMFARIDAHNSGTGALDVTVQSVEGSGGPFTDWNVALGTAAPANARGVGAVVVAPNGTMSAAQQGVVKVTPTSYGQWVKLAAATGYSETGLGVLRVHNAGAYDLGVRDNTGTLLGFVRGDEVADLALSDVSTAAGVWTLRGAELVGTVVNGELAHGLSNPTNMVIREVIELDTERELLILCSSLATQAVVWDNSTSLFGAVATVRTHNGEQRVRAIKSATNQALVVSCNAGTALEGVTLTIAGTTITVNTAAGVTLSAAAIVGQSLSPYGDLIPVAGQGFVFSYSRSSSVQALRALTITGTTVAWGAEAVLGSNGAAYSVQPIFDNGSSRIVTFGTLSANLLCSVFTVSGTTLTPGSTVSLTNGGASESFSVTKLSTGRYASLGGAAGTTATGGIFTIAGTVPTVSSVTFAAAFLSVGAWKNMGSAVLFAGYLSNNTFYVNVLNDVAGVATAGVAITRPTNSGTLNCLRLGSTATQMAVLWGEPSTGRYLWKIGVSGNDPALLNATQTPAGDPTGATAATNPSYPAFNLVSALPETSGRFETVGVVLEQPDTGTAVYTGGLLVAMPTQVYKSRKGVQLEMAPRVTTGRNGGQQYARENMASLWAAGNLPITNTAVQITKLRIA